MQNLIDISQLRYYTFFSKVNSCLIPFANTLVCFKVRKQVYKVTTVKHAI